MSAAHKGHIFCTGKLLALKFHASSSSCHLVAICGFEAMPGKVYVCGLVYGIFSSVSAGRSRVRLKSKQLESSTFWCTTIVYCMQCQQLCCTHRCCCTSCMLSMWLELPFSHVKLNCTNSWQTLYGHVAARSVCAASGAQLLVKLCTNSTLTMVLTSNATHTTKQHTDVAIYHIRCAYYDRSIISPCIIQGFISWCQHCRWSHSSFFTSINGDVQEVSSLHTGSSMETGTAATTTCIAVRLVSLQPDVTTVVNFEQ